MLPLFNKILPRMLPPPLQPVADLYNYMKQQEEQQQLQGRNIHNMPTIYDMPQTPNSFSGSMYTQKQPIRQPDSSGFYDFANYTPQASNPVQKNSAYEPLFPEDNLFVVTNEGDKTNIPDQFYKTADGRYVNAKALAYEQVAQERKKNGVYH